MFLEPFHHNSTIVAWSVLFLKKLNFQFERQMSSKSVIGESDVEMVWISYGLF